MSKNNFASFTFTELFKDLNHDKIFLFILSYEYDLNFNQILTIYNFSPEIFWSYINILKPVLKVGDRKAQMLKKSANSLYYTLLGNKLKLSEKEEEYFKYLSQYINDSFANEDTCYHFTQVKKFPITVNGYFVNSTDCNKLDQIVLNSNKELFKYIDSIESIEYKGKVLTKTSRIQYMFNKYYPELSIKEIRLLSVKDIINKLSAEAVKEHSDYLRSLEKKRAEIIRERVYGTEKEKIQSK